MRIALDSTPLAYAHGGIPRYVTELACALAEGFPEDEIHLLSDQPGLHIDPRLMRLSNVVLDPPSGPRFGGKWWSLGLPWELRRRGVEIFHGTNFEVPYLPGAPSVMTLHDLSPWHPPPIRPEGSSRVRRRAPWLLKRARLVLTPTEAVRAEACQRFGLDSGRVLAIPLGVSAAAAEPRAIGPALGVSPPFALYLGAAGARKNLETAVAAWRLARAEVPGLTLALAGPGTERFQGCCHGVEALGEIAQADADSLLATASVFVYPSYYEGFGLPIVEAMRAGAPVVISGDAALAETAGDAALVAEAGSAESWKAAIVRLVNDPALAAEMRGRGLRRAACFDWRLTAKRTRAAYERAIRRN